MDPQQQQPQPVPNEAPAPNFLPPTPVPAPETPQPVQRPEVAQQYPQPPTPPEQEQPQQYEADQDQDQDQDQDHKPQMEAIAWEASESIHHEKDAIWFISVLVVAVVLSILSIYIQAWTFTVLIVVMVIALVVFAKRPPRLMQYQMTENGIDVNGIHHSFREFRAFGVVQDGPFYYVSLLPIKRFMPAMDVYFPEEHGEDIVDLLGSKIPMQTINPDLLDAITKRLRF